MAPGLTGRTHLNNTSTIQVEYRKREVIDRRRKKKILRKKRERCGRTNQWRGMNKGGSASEDSRPDAGEKERTGPRIRKNRKKRKRRQGMGDKGAINSAEYIREKIKIGEEDDT